MMKFTKNQLAVICAFYDMSKDFRFLDNKAFLVLMIRFGKYDDNYKYRSAIKEYCSLRETYYNSSIFDDCFTDAVNRMSSFSFSGRVM